MIVVAAKNYVFDNVLNSPFQTALAHISNKYGNITVQAGWDQEPPLVDEINDIVVGVTRESDLVNGSAIPVRNALADMSIIVKYGGVTKSLDFVPSEEEAGRQPHATFSASRRLAQGIVTGSEVRRL